MIVRMNLVLNRTVVDIARVADTLTFYTPKRDAGSRASNAQYMY